jgi:hypothetical protein
MTPKEKNMVDGPPIDVLQTATHNLREVQEIVKNVRTYIDDAKQIAVAMKGPGLMSSNMYAYVSAQSALDIALDIESVLDGKHITSIEEMRAEIKKGSEADPNDLPYSY